MQQKSISENCWQIIHKLYVGGGGRGLTTLPLNEKFKWQQHEQL